jgi:hypothetical protein
LIDLGDSLDQPFGFFEQSSGLFEKSFDFFDRSFESQGKKLQMLMITLCSQCDLSSKLLLASAFLERRGLDVLGQFSPLLFAPLAFETCLVEHEPPQQPAETEGFWGFGNLGFWGWYRKDVLDVVQKDVLEVVTTHCSIMGHVDMECSTQRPALWPSLSPEQLAERTGGVRRPQKGCQNTNFEFIIMNKLYF